MSTRRKVQNSSEVASMQNRQNPRNNSSFDESLIMKGIYKNARIMHSAMNMMGFNVHVILKNGEVYEGIFSTISPELDICLEFSNRVDKGITSIDSNQITIVFNLQDIVSVEALDIDLEYAISGDGFTDAAINKASGQIGGQERELEPWQGDGDDSIETSGSIEELAMSKKNGWDANEMFHINSTKFNVTSDYNPKLPGYTTKLKKLDTDEYRAREKSADKQAREIEQNETYRRNVTRENGGSNSHSTLGDEEAKYSAVTRTNPIDGTKYVPPQMRRSNGQQQRGHNRTSDSRSRSDERKKPSNESSENVELEKQQSKEEVLTAENAVPTNATNCDKPLVRDAKIREFKDFKDNFKLSAGQKKSESIVEESKSQFIQNTSSAEILQTHLSENDNLKSESNSKPSSPVGDNISTISDPTRTTVTITTTTTTLSDTADKGLNPNAKVFVPEMRDMKATAAQSISPPTNQQGTPSLQQYPHQQPPPVCVSPHVQNLTHMQHLSLGGTRLQRPIIQLYNPPLQQQNSFVLPLQQAQVLQGQQRFPKRAVVSAAAATGQPLMATPAGQQQSNASAPPPLQQSLGPPPPPPSSQSTPGGQSQNLPPQQLSQTHTGPSPIQQDSTQIPIQGQLQNQSYQILPSTVAQYFHSQATAAAQAAANNSHCQIPPMNNRPPNGIIIPPPMNPNLPYPMQYQLMMPRFLIQQSQPPTMMSGQEGHQIYIQPSQNSGNAQTIPSQPATPVSMPNAANNGSIIFPNQISANGIPTPTSPQNLYTSMYQQNPSYVINQHQMPSNLIQHINPPQMHLLQMQSMAFPPSQPPPPPPSTGVQPPQQGPTPPIMNHPPPMGQPQVNSQFSGPSMQPIHSMNMYQGSNQQPPPPPPQGS